ncbi:unnamed protein product [Merluccius merluccius]
MSTERFAGVAEPDRDTSMVTWHLVHTQHHSVVCEESPPGRGCASCSSRNACCWGQRAVTQPPGCPGSHLAEEEPRNHCAAAVRAAGLPRTGSGGAMVALGSLLGAQCLLYCLAFLLAFISVVPLSENSDDFQGRCLLFTEGRWSRENTTGGGGGGGPGPEEDEEAGGRGFVVEQWAPESSCRFVTFVGILSLLVSAVRAWRSLYCLCRGHDDGRVHVLVSLLLSSSLLCLLLAAGTLSSLGFSAWCTALRDHRHGR